MHVSNTFGHVEWGEHALLYAAQEMCSGPSEKDAVKRCHRLCRHSIYCQLLLYPYFICILGVI